MRRLIVLGAIAALAGCGSTTAKGLTVHVDTHPFRISLVDDGKTIVAQDENARLRYQLASNGEQHKLTDVTSSRGDVYQVATDEPGRTATVTVRKTHAGVSISTVFHPSAGIAQVYDAFGASQKDHFLGSGERSGYVDLRGQVVPVRVSYACSYAPVPFFSSSAGWAVSLSTTRVSALAFPGSAGGTGGCVTSDPQQCSFPALTDRAEVCVEGARLDEVLYRGDFAQTLAAYERLVPPAATPRSELELIKWRDVYDGPAQVYEDIAKLRAAGVPLGWVLVDNPWEKCVGTLSFDTNRFPDPAALIARVHSLGLKFMLWVSPKTQCDVGYTRSELLGDPAAGQDAIDLTNPRVVSIFQSRLRKLVALGVDGVKADRGDEVDLGPALANSYAVRYAQDVMRALPRGSAAIFRAATAGSRVPGIWAGDQDATWDGFEQAIRSGETASVSGFPTWGSDVGGYHSQDLTGDLFVRWAQLGAISPVMEVGGQGANATPWTMGAEAMSALRAAAVLHYELAPTFESLLATGEPVLRPLAYAFPDDPQAWTSDLELMVGPDLLAAPVTGPGTTPSIYLPAGLWVDLHTGQTVKGPAVFTRATPMDELPIYARAGTVVPFNLRTASSWWGTDELSHTGRAGYLVSNGESLDLHRQPRDVQLWVPAPARPASVTLAGKPVRWSWNAGPLPGVVVRVHGPTVRGDIVLHG